VQPLTAAELREAEPGLGPALLGAVLVPGDRWVDNVRLTRAVAASATARGVDLLCGRPVTSLLIRGDRVRAVVAGGETLEAGIVINALGAWAGLLPGDPAPPPVEPVRGHLVAFAVSPGLRHVVVSSRGYLVPRSDGRIVAGSTSEKVGFDKSVTAEGVRAVLDIAQEIAPRLRETQVSFAWSGLRPGTIDGLPILGPGGVAGLFHAAGLYRNGILLGPLVGEMIAEVALGAPLPEALAPFGLSRFEFARTQMQG
jgi:glycine oxidase